MPSSIHIRLEKIEALGSKKDILILQENLLKGLSHIKAYEVLKKREYLLKKKIKKSITEIKNNIILLESCLPEEDIKGLSENYKSKFIKIKTYPRQERYESKDYPFENKEITNQKVKQKIKTQSIESQLIEIRNKLASLT